ncbi:unnamed protein product [Paramecium sonneborni]|uniref:Uncharacterized protein n=1 Tax=Paramecium sonneborni TaxID=65129 RepID=A0A8S1KTS5_9CILI|nr:unnamed protein product [Paramecium sonneborni]
MSQQFSNSSIVFTTADLQDDDFYDFNADQIYDKILVTNFNINTASLRKLIQGYINYRSLLKPIYIPVDNIPSQNSLLISDTNFQNEPANLQQEFIEKYTAKKIETITQIENFNEKMKKVIDYYKEFNESENISQYLQNLDQSSIIQYRLYIKEINAAAIKVLKQWQEFIEYTQSLYNKVKYHQA